MFDIVIERGSGPERSAVSMLALVHWERKSGRSALDLTDGLRLDDLLFLAHETFEKNGKDLDGFIAEVSSLTTEATETPTAAV